jgi:ATP synthase F1 delta subunit
MTAQDRKSAKGFAKKLFNASGIDKAELVIRDLTVLNKVFTESKEIRNCFLSPLILNEERRGAIEGMSHKLGLTAETGKFLSHIAERRAISAMPDVLRQFRNIYYEKKKRAKAVITSSLKIDDHHEKRLLASLKALTGKDIEIEYIHDPELIGGITVKIGSTLYDGSIQGQLRLLKEGVMKG